MARREFLNMDLEDGATPYLASLEKRFPDEFRKALKSIGFYLYNKTRLGMLNMAPGGKRYPALSTVSRLRLLDARRGKGKIKSGKRYRAPRRMKHRMLPFGQLINAVRYKYHSAPQRIEMGWIDQSAQRFAEAVQAGKRGDKYRFQYSKKQAITPKMRRFLAAIGLKTKKTMLEQPERPVIDPIWDRHGREIPGLMEKKISDMLSRTLTRSVRYHSAAMVMGRTERFRKYVRAV